MGILVIMFILVILYFYFLLFKPQKGSNVLSDDKVLTDFIQNTLKKLNYNKKITYIGNSIRRFILLGILAVVTFLDMSYIFIYHNNYWIAVVIEIVAIILLIYSMTKINTLNAIKKKIKASPDNDMEYIIASFYEESSNSKKIISILITIFGFVPVITAVILPFIIFSKPHIIYEKQDDEYCVRYYTMALKPEKNIEIPEKYNGKDVVGIRGNVFINLSSIENVKLPNTIREIRGSAFKNCKNLESINLPSALEEIKGNTFENDRSLKQIVIPEGVTRIGGHAFYGCTSLKNVSIPNTVKEIGSSAFRLCSSLKEVNVPSKAIVNDKAFKGTTVKGNININANDIVKNVLNNLNTNTTNINTSDSENDLIIYNGLGIN